MSSSEQIQALLQNVEIRGKVDDSIQKILTPEAVAFVATLHRTFEPTRRKLIQAREDRQREIDGGKKLDFLPETKHIREDPTWQGPKLAPGLVDRRVEITGPTDRKMVINALNSDVATYMADFEDSSTPTWENMASGQVNLYDAARRQVDFTQAGGKSYKLRTDKKLPTLIVRPRGWHLLEKHLIVDGEPVAGAFFDFGFYFFHNAKVLIAEGYGPYFYLPKMESYLEARLWNDVFNVAQDTVGIPRGTIRGTVLIETIHAAYQMDEIIYELRQHSSGLNCGRWDYIFSTIKTFRNHKDFILPDRSDVTMTVPFMNAYVQLLIQTCHKRGVDAMGGMAAQIPIKNDAQANKVAMEGVYKDKIREATAGHDGTWVAHPQLAHIANEVFNRYMPTPNQIFKRNEDVVVTAADLVNTKFEGKITIEGIRKNLFIGLNYIEAWLRGIGCVPINYLMEDAATAEVSRSQLWQWAKHGAKTADGQTVTPELNLKILREEVTKLDKTAPAGNKFKQAAQIFEKQITGQDYTLFLPSLLYDDVVKLTAPAKL